MFRKADGLTSVHRPDGLEAGTKGEMNSSFLGLDWGLRSGPGLISELVVESLGRNSQGHGRSASGTAWTWAPVP